MNSIQAVDRLVNLLERSSTERHHIHLAGRTYLARPASRQWKGVRSGSGQELALNALISLIGKRMLFDPGYQATAKDLTGYLRDGHGIYTFVERVRSDLYFLAKKGLVVIHRGGPDGRVNYYVPDLLTLEEIT